MILDIINFIEGLIILIIPIYLVYLTIRSMLRWSTGDSIWLHYKHLFCMVVSAGIFISLILMMGISWMQIGLALEEVQTDEVTKNVMYLIVTFIWQAIGLALIFLLWKNIADRQIISGTGNVRERIKQHWLVLKKGIKELKRSKKNE